jgi:hypothetical protein
MQRFFQALRYATVNLHGRNEVSPVLLPVRQRSASSALGYGPLVQCWTLMELAFFYLREAIVGLVEAMLVAGETRSPSSRPGGGQASAHY